MDVCTAVVVAIVHCALVVSARGPRCCIYPAVFTVSTSSSRPTSPQPTGVDRAAVARQIPAAARHYFHYVCRRMGCVVFRAVLDATFAHWHCVLVAYDDDDDDDDGGGGDGGGGVYTLWPIRTYHNAKCSSSEIT